MEDCSWMDIGSACHSHFYLLFFLFSLQGHSFYLDIWGAVMHFFSYLHALDILVLEHFREHLQSPTGRYFLLLGTRHCLPAWLSRTAGLVFFVADPAYRVGECLTLVYIAYTWGLCLHDSPRVFVFFVYGISFIAAAAWIFHLLAKVK